MAAFKLKNSIAVSETGFLFVPGTGDSFSVNPVGVEVINLLKQGISEKEVKKGILARYDIDEASFEKDLYDFINQLKQYNLIALENEN